MVATLLLAACETTAPPAPGQPPAARPDPQPAPLDDPRSLERRAAGAANANPLLLRAAELYLDREQPGDARRVLERTSPDGLTESQVDSRHLLIARLLLQQDQPRAALERLQRRGPLAADARLVAGDVRVRALEQLGQRFEAVMARLARNPLLDGDARTRNEDQIWATLRTVPAWELEQLLAGGELERSTRGWLELAIAMQGTASSRRAVRANLADWQARWSRHPAARFIPAADKPMGAAPDHVTIVLPLSGPLAPAGRAVRDGIIAAWLHDSLQGEAAIESSRLANPFAPPATRRQGGERVRLSIIDTNANGVTDALNEATRRGAQLIIGPLAKDAVLEASRVRTNVPVLALNYLPDPAPGVASGAAGPALPGFTQYGLLTEAESRTLAARALRDMRPPADRNAAVGGPRALLLAADAGWAQRISSDLESRWLAGGGLIVARAALADVRETNTQVRALLQVDASQARADRIAGLLGMRPQFSPRRRQDIDVVLLVAPPTLARVAAATLAYNFADNLPVYATSHVYAGADADPSVDLDGVRFCDIPWRLLDSELRQRIERHAPGASGTQGALYALGIDAWRLHDRLDLLADGASLFGATGLLALDTAGNVQRELMWATFRNGRPLPVPVITGGIGH